MRPPKPTRVLLFLLACVLFFGWMFSSIGARDIPFERGNIEVTFCPIEDCEHVLLTELRHANDIVCAFYDLNLKPVSNELSNADVLVFEENTKEFFPVSSKGLMHHKFCVLDGKKVITGSMNPTENGVNKNDNNLVVIESAILARRYLQEFEELGKKKNSKKAIVNLSGTIIEVFFCPQDDCEQQILQKLHGAKESIRFMLFTFTSDAVGDALIAANERGIDIQGVIEKRQRSKWSEHHKLRQWNVDVRFDSNPWTMHHKVFVIDNQTVITGSYNPTWAAAHRNDENLLIIHDKEIAAEFLGEFDRIWTRASLAAQ